MDSNHRSRGQEGRPGPISRPAEGDDQESAASTSHRSRSSKSCYSIPTSCRPLSWAFLKSSPRQSSCGAGRQRIRWLAETCPNAAPPRLATAGAVPPCEKQAAPVPCSLPAAHGRRRRLPRDPLRIGEAGFLRAPCSSWTSCSDTRFRWIEITAKSQGSLIRRINSLMTRFNSLLGQK
jgi:hypothetical protein